MGDKKLYREKRTIVIRQKPLNFHTLITSDRQKCLDDHLSIYTLSFKKRKSCKKLYIEFCLKKLPIHFLQRFPGSLIFMAYLRLTTPHRAWGLFYQQPKPTMTIWLNGLKKAETAFHKWVYSHWRLCLCWWDSYSFYEWWRHIGLSRRHSSLHQCTLPTKP